MTAPLDTAGLDCAKLIADLELAERVFNEDPEDHAACFVGSLARHAINALTAKDSELAEARAALARAEEQLRNLDDCCERMQADAIRWVDRIRALEEALEPFKRLADSYFYRYETRPGEFRESHENDPDERAVYGINRVEITTGDFRRARTVLSREASSNE